MSKWLTQLFEKKKTRAEEEGLDEQQATVFVNDLLACYDATQKTAVDSSVKSVTDVAQTTTSSGLKALRAAEDEAARIIEKAKQTADEIRRRAETVTLKEVEDILSVAGAAGRDTAEEAKQRLQAYLIRAREEIEKEVRQEHMRTSFRALSSLVSRIRKAFPSAKRATRAQIEPELPAIRSDRAAQKRAVREATASQTTKPSTEVLPEKEPVRQEPASVQQKLDAWAIYEGEIELAIAVPVDLAAVSKLYNYLQTTTDIKILYTRGSWDRGTIITVTLDKPLPFFGMISKIPGLSITQALPQKDNLKTPSGSLLGAKRKAVTRINLNLKTE
ncbi:MAG: hypothetical protein HYX80_06830 [Chloroflexi bacterium]|nr:hypothetical protein [Chloroflexota bacterium]